MVINRSKANMQTLSRTTMFFEDEIIQVKVHRHMKVFSIHQICKTRHYNFDATWPVFFSSKMYLYSMFKDTLNNMIFLYIQTDKGKSWSACLYMATYTECYFFTFFIKRNIFKEKECKNYFEDVFPILDNDLILKFNHQKHPMWKI